MATGVSPTYLLAGVGCGIFLICFAAAAAIWLFAPRWLAANFAGDGDKKRLEIEEVYRRTLGQIFGFPLAVVGVAAAGLGALQALATYSQSKELEYQNQYSRGFEALASQSMEQRIGALYLLQGLVQNSELAAQSSMRGRGYVLLSALSVFAIDHSSTTKPAVGSCDRASASSMRNDIVKSDVLVALQIIAFRKPGDSIRFNIRSGNFPGSILADLSTQAYFENADLDMSNLTGSDLYKANFTQASLRFGHFDGANLAGAILTRAGLTGTTFCAAFNSAVPALVHDYPIRTQLAGSYLDSTFGENTRFTDAWMVGAHLQHATLTNASFRGAVLDVAHFENAQLDNPDFRNASLQGTEFKGASLRNARFEGARIRNVNFAKTGVSSNDLKTATLCNVIDTTGNALPSTCGPESDWTPTEAVPTYDN
ncbi:hypothetical protein A6U85_31505 [Agrobacterium sp. 13-626]|jgi:uncharacterized protein YjbI with pentapeptide repeats|nr:hypothetical protein A6U85_31505 [Agrobacterium sp. 13-626]